MYYSVHPSFYIMGGGRLRKAQPVDILYGYFYTQNTWIRLSTYPDPQHGLPRPRCSFGLAQVGRHVYICGGQHYGPGVNETVLFDDVWHFSLDTFSWRKLTAKLPEPVYFHTVALSPSHHMYVYGGVLRSGRRSNKLYRYRLPFHIPKLSEISWDVLCTSWKFLHREDPKSLRHINGVPAAFCDRII